MSPLLLLLLGLPAFTAPAHAQPHFCGRPLSFRHRQSSSEESRIFRGRRQAEFVKPSFPPPRTSPAPYSSCGAVPVSDRFLVTAAYCVLDPNRPVSSVRLGDLDLTRDGEANSRPAEYDIELIVIHPNFTYNPETQIRYSDLALLKTTRRIEFNEAVFPYCLSPGRPAPGTTVIASGFGYVNETHKPTHLQEGLLSVMHPTVCERLYRSRGKEALLRRAYPNLLQGSGIVCAGHPERGACKGDEGGPLLREDASGRRFLEGVISFTGDVCGHNMLPSVSVSIADHYDFIVRTLRTA